MTGMTTQERINDICKISGLSEEIVRRVMDAERKSVAKSLKRGERANLIGRAVIRPEVRRRLLVGGSFETYIKLSVSAAASLENLVSSIEIEDEPVKTEQTQPGIRLNQIASLT